MRERAISAAVLVPVLLIVLAIGGPAIALAIALITAIAAVEVFRLDPATGDLTQSLGVFATGGSAEAIAISTAAQ